MASNVATAADKAEDWIADTQHKFNEGANKAQDAAWDTKVQAQETVIKEQIKEPASDARYHSTARGQNY
jgi:hypothetical protein